MLLASVQEIREQLGFDDMTDINFAVTMAMHAIEPQLASRLSTDFTLGDVTDTFWVPEPTFKEGKHEETHFRLSRGFVGSFTSIVLGSDPTDFSGATSITGDIAADYQKGTVRDWSNRYDRSYIRFVYSAGFAASGVDATSYDLTQVPLWLQQAAKIATLAAIADAPSLTEANIRLDKKMLSVQLDALLGPHLRFAPLAYLPL